MSDAFAARAEQARRRALRSRLILRLAVLAGIGLGAAFFGQGLLTQPAPVETAKPVDKAAIISGSASNFGGTDVHGKPFNVRAAQGQQDATNDALMHLQKVSGRFVRKTGGEVQVTADNADYETRSKDLAVKGNVVFEEPGRYVARLVSAEVNLERQRIVTDKPVIVETPNAKVVADRMETSEDGSVITLQGHVRADFAAVDID